MKANRNSVNMTPQEMSSLTRNLAIAALGVGSLIVGKKYFENKAILQIIDDSNFSKKSYENCFTIDRLIDADCAGKSLAIGIYNDIHRDNILSHQGIRLGQDGEIKRLVSFVKADNALIYTFEDNTRLTMSKNDKTNKIIYSFEMPGKTIVKQMDDRILSLYKTIGMSSYELDRISELK